MSDKISFNGILNRLKQNQVLYLMIGLGVLFLVFVFISFKNLPEQEVSLAQALTMVAGASQTAQAANPGFSASQAARPSHVATKVAIGTPSPGSSSVDSTRTPSTRFPTATRNSDVSYPTQSNTGQNNFQETIPTYPVSNATVRPTYTPKPTGTKFPTARPTAKPTSTATPGPGLPGLSMSAVIGRLKNEKGFTCTQEGSSPGPILWMCDVQKGNDIWYHVDLYGSPEIEVTNLLSVFQTHPDDARAVDILSFVASLPYDGSNAADAGKWVVESLPNIQSVDDVKEKFIGRVRFRLYGGSQGRYLEMGEPVQ